MRGLLFTGGVQPDMGTARLLFGRYTVVVAADSGLCGAEAAGIVPDIIVGDMDSVPDASILDKYPADKVQVWPRDKDFTDTEIALRCMEERHIDEVILVGGSGGRLDHFFALKALFDAAYAPSLWIGETSVVAVADGGSPRDGIRVSGLSGDDPVSLFAAGSGPHGCRGSGFHWPVDNIDWAGGKFSLSNRSDTGSIRFEALSGRFLLVVPLRAGVTVEQSTGGS